MSETKRTFLPWRSVITSAYRDGFKEGIRLFAWWKDGVQQVGTTGTTFKEAVAKDIPTEVDCDAYLTEAAKQEVAARPKVEEAIRAANAAEKWRESQREPTLRADEWQAVLGKLRALESALGGKAE